MNTIEFLLTATSIALLVIATTHIMTAIYINTLIKKNEYPKKGEESMSHVEELIAKRKPILAMRCYRQITGASLKEASHQIKKIQTANQSKNKGY